MLYCAMVHKTCLAMCITWHLVLMLSGMDQAKSDKWGGVLIKPCHGATVDQVHNHGGWAQGASWC